MVRNQDTFASHIKGGGHSHMIAQPLSSDCGCPFSKLVIGHMPGSLVARRAWDFCSEPSKILIGMLVSWHLSLIPHLVLKSHLAVKAHPQEHLVP